MINMITFNTFTIKANRCTALLKRMLVLGCVCLAAIAVNGQARVNSLTAIQYSRMDTEGKMLFANSSLAAVRFFAIPDATQTWYLNIVAKGINNEDVWMVQNFPIFSRANNYSPSMRQLELDLKYLNIRPGTSIRSVKILQTVTPDLLTRMPAGTFTSVQVSSEIFSNESIGDYNETTTYAGYVGMRVPADVNIHNDSFPSIQEHTRGCTEGSFSRSIAWLNKKYGLGCTLTPQQIYDLLYGKTGPLSYDSTVAIKARLLDSIAKAGGKRGKTEFNDRGNYLGNIANITTTPVIIKEDTVKNWVFEFDNDLNSINHANNTTFNGNQTDVAAMSTAVPPTGTGSSSSGNLGEVTITDPVGWLKDNLSGNDIELHYDDHMITVTGITCSGGVCTITYRDDEYQNNPNRGDSAEKTAEVKGDSIKMGGTWYPIKVLFKESITAGTSRVAVQAPQVELLPNKPNPFNSTTTIGINVKKGAQYKNAELVIRDIHGSLVQRIRLKLQPGLNEVQFNTRNREKGALVYTLELDGKPVQSRQMYVDRP